MFVYVTTADKSDSLEMATLFHLSFPSTSKWFVLNIISTGPSIFLVG
jgi:hypothetical protein